MQQTCLSPFRTRLRLVSDYRLTPFDSLLSGRYQGSHCKNNRLAHEPSRTMRQSAELSEVATVRYELMSATGREMFLKRTATINPQTTLTVLLKTASPAPDAPAHSAPDMPTACNGDRWSFR